MDTFPGINTYRDVKEVDAFYLFGENPNTGFLYGIDAMTSTINLVDNTNFSAYQAVAKDDYLFFDALYEYAKFLKKEIYIPEEISLGDRMALAHKCSTIAGLSEGAEFWVQLIGA